MKKTDSQLQLLQRIAFSLDELVKWTRVMSYPSVKQVLETVLDTDEKRLVYHLLDGTKTVTAIQQLTGVNVRYISEWGQEWERIGIAESSIERKGRRQKLFDITMFGIPIPDGLVANVTDHNG